MNFLLLLTALLTSLTGMISGDRAGASRVQAAAFAGEQDRHIADQAAHAAVAIAATLRPDAARFTLQQTILPLPRVFALFPAIRLAAEKRRE